MRTLVVFAVSLTCATYAGLLPQNGEQYLYSNSFGVPTINATYDFVVIGGGTAGNAIAARLADKYSVAVIEAGGFYQVDNGNGSVIPAVSPAQFTGTDPSDTQPLIDWGFVTTPQAGADNRRMHYARGKTLGGSSARNYMVYQRGTAGSYQKWADEVGDQSYTWSNILPYFKRSAHLTPPDMTTRFPNASVSYDSNGFDPSGGPLEVGWARYAYPFGTWAQAGMVAAGVPISPDGFNSGNLSGSSWSPSTISPDKQHRSSSQTSFLDQAMRTTDIKVYTQALAKKILFDGQRATGVLVDTGGKQYVLQAVKEVIVSAGAFQSPQMLMVSGIGPAETLQSYGIPVVRDLPGVGQNLWDHALFGVSYRVNVPTISLVVYSPDADAAAASAYLINATGVLTAPPSMLAWERLPAGTLSDTTLATVDGQFPPDWPQIEYLVQNGYGAYYRNSRTADPGDGYNYATIAASVISTLSRGNITISSSDMSDPPVINPNWLTDPGDVEMAMAAFGRLREIWGNMTNITIGPEYLPGPNVTTYDEILHFVRENLLQVYHAAATCKMGKSDDPMAVVDSSAKVMGVEALRVVDASAFPFLIPGHPQSSVYMLAEKIADDILNGK